jgi:hypothetical protein
MPARRHLLGLLAPLAGAQCLWLVFGAGSANYDTMFALVWGREIASGTLPEYALALAPTPKPGVIALGAVLAPLGHGAETVTVLLSYVSLGALAAACFWLAHQLAGPVAGAIAAVLVLTRVPILSFGLRAYADVAYAALVLGAAAMEVRRPRAGGTVLALLSIAGLLRPEAWLFTAAYAAWLWPVLGLAKRLRACLWVLAAPVIWIAGDAIATADPLWSLTGTRATAEALARETGIGAVVRLTPRRLGEIVREPVLIAAPLGLALSLFARRRDAARLFALAVIAIAAFSVAAAAGLPVLGRYLLLPACLLIVWSAVALGGWWRLDGRLRRLWQLAGAVSLVAAIAFAPAQVRRLKTLERVLGDQAAIARDLHALADVGALEHCGSIIVPNHRPVPPLALWLDRTAESVASGLNASRGTFLTPASERVGRLFALDRRDPARARAAVSGRRVAQSRFWRVTVAC